MPSENATEALGMYLNALNEVMQSVGRLKAIDEYHEALMKFVKLPIKVPKIETYARDRLKERMPDVEKAFRNIAVEMGNKKVIAPKFQGDEIVLEEVDVEKIKLEYYEHELRGPTHYGEVIIIKLVSPPGKIAEFPVAWEGSNDEGVYYAHVYTILLTALTVGKNPWIPQALRRAIETVFSDYVKMREDAFTFYNALRMLGAEDA